MADVGLSGLLSPLLTAASNTVGAYEGAQADAGKQRKAEALQQVLQLRAQHEQEIKDLLTQAQTRNTNRQADALRLGDVDYAGAMGGVKAAENSATIPGDVAREQAVGPVKTANAVAQQGALLPGKVAEQSAMIPGKVAEQTALTPGAVDRAGRTSLAEVPGKVAAAQQTAEFAAPIATQDRPGDPTSPVTYKTRSQALGTGKAPTGTADKANPQQAASKANIESAMKTMDDFEQKLRSGHAVYGPFDATKGALASSEQTQNAKGSLGGLESLAGNIAGASLRGDNSDLAQYLKAKKFVAEAVLNTHKRPNQTQYEIEQELSGIGPRFDGWNTADAQQQIKQTADRRNRMYHEVFGGATVQPQQGNAPKGNVDLNAPLPPLSAEDRAHAQRDPAFAAWLKNQGYP